MCFRLPGPGQSVEGREIERLRTGARGRPKRERRNIGRAIRYWQRQSRARIFRLIPLDIEPILAAAYLREFPTIFLRSNSHTPERTRLINV